MTDRYTTPEMATVWSPETKFALWLEIELLACEAQASLGVIPAAVAQRLRQHARVGTPARIDEIERTQTQHDVVAFLRSVAEETGEDARFVHHGLGSTDVVDTALAVLLVRAVDLIIGEGQRVRDGLARLADTHRYTVMAGRTHGLHAEPTTFGLKAALWFAELERGLERLQRTRAQIAVAKLSGEVGTYATLDPAVEAHVCQALGLTPARIASQVIQRDRHAEYVCTLAIVGGTAEKIATEIRALARTEIRELEEPFLPGQTGSSAMPHKRNPILCERICGLARVVRGYALMSLENQALWGERDISHSSAERIALPGATTLIHYMLGKLAFVLDHLRVDPDAMRRNLERTGGLVFSHRVLLALLNHGLDRDAAYRIVQDAATAAWEGREDFKAALLRSSPLTAADLERAFDVAAALSHVDAILDRVGVVRETRVPAPPSGRGQTASRGR